MSAIQIIGGVAGGIRLRVPRGNLVRPTLARARAGLFDSLGPWTGRTVVDLFAGSGAFACEALSRGGTEAHCFEVSPLVRRVLSENAAAVSRAGVAGKLTIHATSAARASSRLPELAGREMTLFADPPHAEFAVAVAELLGGADFAVWARRAIFIWEMPPPDDCPASFPPSGPWRESRRCRFAGVDFRILIQ